MSRRLCAILGSTGSIGTQTLDVIRAHPERFGVHALTTNRNVSLLCEQVEEFAPEVVVVCDARSYDEARARLGDRTRVLFGSDECGRIAADPAVDIVVNALVGFAGLEPTLSAAAAGKHVALANKEALVVAGHLVARAAAEGGGTILPVDSEHSAIRQAITGEDPRAIDRVILTASGGPFRAMPIGEFASITPESALRHPTWQMGAKITIDSATMMNKGLEVIEAGRLFDIPADRIDVVVHPESIIHSMVRFVDGSIKAQLSMPDMRMPIRYALAWPERIAARPEELDLASIGALHFERPDHDRFPCLQLAYDALRRDGTAPTVLNAANEIAVAAFLDGTIGFTDIPRSIARALEESDITDDPSLHDIIAADKRTREMVRSYFRRPEQGSGVGGRGSGTSDESLFRP